MADYEKIIELRPEMREFFENRKEIGFRGDVLAYRSNQRADGYSTDAAGFRHSTLKGREYSVGDCLSSDRYGIALGASNLFGFGVAGNENCLPSLLAERFGFPFANATIPGGNSRNLQALLVGLIAGAKHAPEVVVFSNGGDLAGFCECSIADPIFGSPNRSQIRGAAEGKRLVGNDPERNFERLKAFTGLWASIIVSVCRVYKSPLVLIQQSTFFEKTKPTAIELECGLGKPFHPSQERAFANFRKFNEPFYAERKAIANRLGVPLAGWGMQDELTFIDEFHCDSDGVRVMSKAVGDEVERLLSAGVPAQNAEAPAA
ncbi:MAG TPA: hypothetical protein VE820_03475 [Sphingomicrobium sp.]|jgi:hypothetical protein|nr:hypothetical protein [Sphingomicrobium sp.]